PRLGRARDGRAVGAVLVALVFGSLWHHARQIHATIPGDVLEHRPAALDTFLAGRRVAASVNAGSSLKLCLVAAGEADLYPRLGRTMEWDTAAGDAVLRGAGGHVVRFEDHSPLTYGKPGFENPFFIAHAPGVALEKA
ncbi:MAG: hypothetical protein NWR52_09090, partial [Paracoccaceae bacterium]|nr:hypothetical protein [Paracoccaceae bacterium]